MSQNNDDILPLMAPFFDVHMTLQLLNFAVEVNTYLFFFFLVRNFILLTLLIYFLEKSL